MPLNIGKLQDLLNKKGFEIDKYFVLDGSVFYMELISTKTAEVFLLYIPSKYEFAIGNERNVYKLKYIDMENTDTVADEYAGAGDSVNVAEAYGNMNVELSPDKDHIEEHLENNYKQQITLDDISGEDSISLRAIYRQVKRLRYCVQNVKYKLAIQYKNYICSVRRDDSVDCFFVKHLPRSDSKKLLVIIDLETFYEKNEKLLEDVHTVRESLYRVLERNQGMHSRVINKMIDVRKDISAIPILAEKKKIEYDRLMLEHEQLLKIMAEAEVKTMEKMYELDKQENTGLSNDITRAHQKVRFEKELAEIATIKALLIKNIISLREKRENAMINIDKIMFDNTVMWDSIVRGFANLKEFC